MFFEYVNTYNNNLWFKNQIIKNEALHEVSYNQ